MEVNTTSAKSAAPSRAPGKPARQTTLTRSATVAGVGLVTGADVELTFHPSPADTGIVFRRVDLPGKPCLKAQLENVVQKRRRTSLAAPGATIEMVEHVLSALFGLGIDNCIIDLNAGETPGMDGSALAFVEAIDRAGLTTLEVPRRPFTVEDAAWVREEQALVAAHPGTTDSLQITYNLDYTLAGRPLQQSLTVDLSPDLYRRDIAPARTFVLLEEVAALQAQGLGTRATTKDLLVLGPAGAPIDNVYRFPDELVRHKILDVIGDLALLGRPLHGHVLAHRSGHWLTVALAQELAKSFDARRQRDRLTAKPLLDATQIERILPHRYPFLLVDRVLELDPNRRAMGIKNVSYNEPFFQGHWPGRPVMPGVLIVEAMAQLAGLMITQWQDAAQQRFAMLVALDKIKLRRPVIPGDQLTLEAQVVRLKSRTALLRTCASVAGELAAEAEMSFMLCPAPTVNG